MVVIESNRAALLFPNRISFSCNILLQVNPEGQNQINNDGRTDADKSSIDKKQSDIRRGNAEFLTQVGANAENSAFHKVLHPVHGIKIVAFLGIIKQVFHKKLFGLNRTFRQKCRCRRSIPVQ
jgi:hypothetical protein